MPAGGPRLKGSPAPTTPRNEVRSWSGIPSSQRSANLNESVCKRHHRFIHFILCSPLPTLPQPDRSYFQICPHPPTSPSEFPHQTKLYIPAKLSTIKLQINSRLPLACFPLLTVCSTNWPPFFLPQDIQLCCSGALTPTPLCASHHSGLRVETPPWRGLSLSIYLRKPLLLSQSLSGKNVVFSVHRIYHDLKLLCWFIHDLYSHAGVPAPRGQKLCPLHSQIPMA